MAGVFEEFEGTDGHFEYVGRAAVGEAGAEAADESGAVGGEAVGIVGGAAHAAEAFLHGFGEELAHGFEEAGDFEGLLHDGANGRADHGLGQRLGGKNNDRHQGIFAGNAFKNLPAVAQGEIQVEEHQVEAAEDEAIDSFLTVGGENDFVILPAQYPAQGFADSTIRIHNQHFVFHTSPG